MIMFKFDTLEISGFLRFFCFYSLVKFRSIFREAGSGKFYRGEDRRIRRKGFGRLSRYGRVIYLGRDASRKLFICSVGFEGLGLSLYRLLLFVF